MRSVLLRVVLSFAGVLCFACGDDDSSSDGSGATGPVSDCSACGSNQICVRVFGGEDTIACEAIPAECNGTADCFEASCASAMYAFCPDGFVNTACSDTFPPTVISCNP